MEQTISITQQWQIYLPQNVRKKVGLTKPTMVNLRVEKGKIVVQPIKSRVLKLGGILSAAKPKTKINIEKIRDSIDYSQW